MKTIKLLFATLFLGLAFTSCSVVIDDDYDDPYYVNLENVVNEFDIWYVDYHSTTGSGDVPFLSKAFTISFVNGGLYANNNLVGIGNTGNGMGIKIGYYDTRNGYLEIDHDLDGYYDFDVVEISRGNLKLIDNYNNVTYYLEGYQTHNFDYDKIFYENIEYFLQEYTDWAKTYTSNTGDLNEFDNENFLAFTPENVTTFYSSQDNSGTNIANVQWDYVGEYTVYNVDGYDDLKILELNYDNWGVEEFELTILNDGTIELYHLDSDTTYEFKGRGYIQYKKETSVSKDTSDNTRKRTKVSRETKVRKNRK